MAEILGRMAMVKAYQQLDKRLAVWAQVAISPRPHRGWIKAIRQALGMTTRQFSQRIGLAQSWVVEIEQREVDGTLTLATLERAAQALGCRLVYALVPEKPLTETLRQRARVVAERRLGSVEQTMRLEDQAVSDGNSRRETQERLADQLLLRPTRLWDEP